MRLRLVEENDEMLNEGVGETTLSVCLFPNRVCLCKDINRVEGCLSAGLRWHSVCIKEG